MDLFNCSHQGTYIVSKDLKTYYRYLNHAKENFYMLLSKGVRG